MIFKNGIPKPNGATDWQDSPHLTGMLAMFDSENFSRVEIDNYFDGDMNYQRTHFENNYSFSRDQFIPFAYALYESDNADMIDLKKAVVFERENAILIPAHKEHFL